MRTSTHDNNNFQVRAKLLSELAVTPGEQVVSVGYGAERSVAGSRSGLCVAERVLLV